VRERGIYQLRVAAVSAGAQATPRVVFDNPDVAWLAPYDWTPDGRFIAVVLQRKDRTAALGLVATADGAFVQLQTVQWDSVSNAALSPRGDVLAFDRRQPDGARDIFVLSIDGSRETPVVASRADDTLVGWSPDGRHLLFLSNRGDAVGLWSVAIGEQYQAGQVHQVRSNVGRFWPVGVTRQGAVLGAVVTAGGAELRFADATFDLGRVTGSTVVDEFVGPGTMLSWSHDGRWLASASQYIGLRPLSPMFGELMSRLAVHSATADVSRALTRTMQYVNSLEWTADDRALIAAGASFRERSIRLTGKTNHRRAHHHGPDAVPDPGSFGWRNGAEGSQPGGWVGSGASEGISRGDADGHGTSGCSPDGRRGAHEPGKGERGLARVPARGRAANADREHR
jgi:dipeptidyl aminopeptidase/acylaminoacyl peptidase